MSILTSRQNRPVPLHPGVLATAKRGNYASRFCVGAAPTQQVDRITLSSTTATEVTVTVELGGDSTTVSQTFAGTVDATNTAALLLKLQQDALFAAYFDTLASATSTTIDLTALRAETPTVTVTGVGISVAETVAAAASPELSYGRVYPVGTRTTAGELTATSIATRSVLAGPTATLTSTFDDAGDDYDISGILQNPQGQNVPFAVTDNVGADLPAMLVAVAASLEGIVSGSTTSTATPAITWNLPVGWVITQLSTAADNSSNLTNVIAANGIGSSVPEVVGIMKNPMNDEYADFSGTYKTGRTADRGVTLIEAGVGVSVPLASGTTPSDGDPVWVETAAGGNYGLCYDTPSPSRYLLSTIIPGAKFRAPSSAAIGVVEV
jgi:hypothetical protein